MDQLKFVPGDRVRVVRCEEWPQGAIGTIKTAPEFAQQLVADHEPWDGCHRWVKGRTKLLEFYWVEFDEPAPDSSDDGPYSAGEILADHISLLREEPNR